MLIRTENLKQKFVDNHFHNIFRLSDILKNFSFTTSENDAWLLLIKMEYTSWLTSCQMTLDLGSVEIGKD